MDNLMTPEELAERHRRQLDGLGFTRNDWSRIRAMADEATRFNTPKALEDLSMPYRVGATMLEIRSRMTGRQIGVITGLDGQKRAILLWPMNERELEKWRRRR